MTWWWASTRHDALNRAVRAVAQVEAASPAFPAPSRGVLDLTGWQAIRRGVPDDVLRQIPRDERQASDPGGTLSTVRARTSASAIRLAKLSDPAALRARAFYLNGGASASVKLAAGPGRGYDGVLQEVAVRSQLGEALPAPTIIDAGTVGEVAYYVETLVAGDHPALPADRQRLAMRLVDDLLAFHRAEDRAGRVTDEPFDWHPETDDRLTAFIDGPWANDAGIDVDLAAPIRRIVGDTRTVPVAWSHGDLHFSNILVTDDGSPVIVDWEHAGRMPAATDLTKLAATASGPKAVAERILDRTTSADIGVRPGRMPVADQLAAVVIRELSWWEGRRDRAAAAGRLDAFGRGIRRRVRLLAFLVAAGAGRSTTV